MDVCQIVLCDGIGNVIQSIPFIKQIRTMCKKLIALDRADSPETSKIVAKLFDDVIPLEFALPYTKYSIPPLAQYKHTPEYKSWFEFHKIPEPSEYKITYDDVSFEKVDIYVDYVLWGGCKPKWKSKQWPYWPELAKLLLDTGYSVGVIGLPNEGGVFPTGVIDLRGKISLLQTGGIISNALRYVGNEGGLTHYANALNSDMWVVWGGTSKLKNMPPPRLGYHNISLNLSCQPCQYRLPGTVGCGVYDCLTGISAETVFNQITEDL